MHTQKSHQYGDPLSCSWGTKKRKKKKHKEKKNNNKTVAAMTTLLFSIWDMCVYIYHQYLKSQQRQKLIHVENYNMWCLYTCSQLNLGVSPPYTWGWILTLLKYCYRLSIFIYSHSLTDEREKWIRMKGKTVVAAATTITTPMTVK